MGRDDPHARLERAVSEWSSGDIRGSVPKRWERFSDVAIIPRGSFDGPEWEPDEGLWQAVAGALGAKRLARMGEVSGEMRESGVEMLLGEDDWVERKEGGVVFGYYLTRIMWSKGNLEERARMGRATLPSEVCVDLYSGIGYYTLPALVNGGASLVHACEWNEVAVECLNWGLKANGVDERCIVHEGDCRVTSESLRGVADRVFLGLLPSCEEGLESAIGVLKESGGTLHVHGLADPSSYASWVDGIEARVASMRPGSSLESSINRVKSYAPRVDHVVLDLVVE